MKIRIAGFIIIGLMLLAAPCRAADKDRFLDIQTVKGKSGVTAWLVEDHTLPIIAIEFAWRDAGTTLDPVDKQGLARLVANTLDEGAGDLNAQAFQKALDDNSITLGFGANRDYFTGSLKTLSRNSGKAFDLLHLALTSPRFEEEAIERMRRANISRVRSSMADPDWLGSRLLNATVFENHPYGFNSGGTLTTLKSITAADMKSFPTAHLALDNLVIGVSGDITPKDLAKALDKIFNGLSKKNTAVTVQQATLNSAGQIVSYEKDSSTQTVIQAMLPGVSRTDPDYYAFQVMNLVYGGSGFGSRLMEEVREKRGLTYGIYSSPWNLDHFDGLSIGTSTENANAGEVIKIIQDEATRIAATPVSAPELDSAKSYLIGSLPLGLTSASAVAATALSLQLNHRPADYLDSYAAKIESVDAAALQRVAQRLMKPEAMTIIMVGKPTNITPTKTVTTLPNVE